MTETTKTQTAKPARGKGFPILSLPQATKIIREAGAYGKQHTANALAAYAGHKTANSGPWRAKAAALRDWGLISTVPPDSFILTERAMQIAHPTSPDIAQKAMSEAFRNCKLYIDIYEDLAKGVELQAASIANKAVTEHGISIASKDGFARSFVESAVAVGLAEQVSAESIRLLAPKYEDEESTALPNPAGPRNAGRDTNRTSTGASRNSEAPHATVPVIHQVWPLRHGEVALSITSTTSLDATAFSELGKVVGAIESFVSIVGGPEPIEQVPVDDVSE